MAAGAARDRAAKERKEKAAMDLANMLNCMWKKLGRLMVIVKDCCLALLWVKIVQEQVGDTNENRGT